MTAASPASWRRRIAVKAKRRQSTAYEQRNLVLAVAKQIKQEIKAERRAKQ